MDELFTIERSLFQTKCGNPLHFIIQGERGIGKSSLLYITSDIAAASMPPFQAPPMRFVVLLVDLGNAQNQLDIVKAIARELKSELSRRNALRESAKRVGISFLAGRFLEFASTKAKTSPPTMRAIFSSIR